MTRLMFARFVLAASTVANLCGAGEPIRNDTAWKDTDGNPISGHDGGIATSAWIC